LGVSQHISSMPKCCRLDLDRSELLLWRFTVTQVLAIERPNILA
jgi:hypothetical protein